LEYYFSRENHTFKRIVFIFPRRTGQSLFPLLSKDKRRDSNNSSVSFQSGLDNRIFYSEDFFPCFLKTLGDYFLCQTVFLKEALKTDVTYELDVIEKG